MPGFSSPVTFRSRGRYADVKINRNLLFYNAPNANSRTLRVTITNIDSATHQYTIVLAAGTMGNWVGGEMKYTYATVTLNPGETKEIDLDIGNAKETPPISNVEYTHFALHVFMGNSTTPDVVIWPLFVLNVTSDPVVYITFDKKVKYLIQGSALIFTGYANFFISDFDYGDYVPYEDVTGKHIDKGLIVAISPFDRTAGVVDIRDINPPGPLLIKLNPVTTRGFKVGADIIVDYNKLGEWLGGAYAWITALGVDAVSVFLNNKFIQYLFLHGVAPFITEYWGSQHVSIDAYVDPNDRTKVHIVVFTYYNINDDPLPQLVLIAVIAIAVAIGIIGIAWIVHSVTTAEVQKKQIECSIELANKCLEIITNPNLSSDVKEYASKICGPALNACSQTTGIPTCKGWAIGDTCIEWWVFAVIAAILLVILILSK